MCPQCIGYAEKIRVDTPDEFLDLIKQLKVLVSKSTFSVTGNCELDSIGKGKAWPEDNISLYFKCSKCNQLFSLAVNTYHGSGGYWMPEGDEK